MIPFSDGAVPDEMNSEELLTNQHPTNRAEPHEHGIICEYKVSPEAFMVLELVPNALEQVSGIARYHSAFASL